MTGTGPERPAGTEIRWSVRNSLAQLLIKPMDAPMHARIMRTIVEPTFEAIARA